MKIISKSPQFNQNEIAKSWLFEFVKQCCLKFEKKLSLEEIVIAEDSQFGNEIFRLQKYYNVPTGFTNNDGNIAIGKAITSNEMKSSIVFRDFIFGGIFSELQKAENIKFWVPEVQLFYYVIFHELSHCYDDINRKTFHEKQQFKRSNFNVSIIKEHFIATLFSEFAACSLSRNHMSNPVFNQEVKNTVDSCNTNLSNLLKIKIKYCDNRIEKVDIAYQAAQLAWFIIVQFSKLIGSNIQTENRYDLAKISRSLHSAFHINPMLERLEEHLLGLWKVYPLWAKKLDEPFFQLWRDMTATFGFDFAGEILESLKIRQM